MPTLFPKASLHTDPMTEKAAFRFGVKKEDVTAEMRNFEKIVRHGAD